MNKLPLELVEAVLDHLPTSSCATARLTSRAFNAILAKRTFHVLATFLDADVAQKTLVVTARDPARRTRAIWSPHCLVPEGLPITESFLLALWASVHGASWNPPPRSGEGKRLIIAAIQNGLGRVGVTVESLRDTLFRYALYLSYMGRDEKMAPQAWVLDFLIHRDTERTRRKTPGIIDTEKEAAPAIAYWEGPSVIDLKE